MGRYVDLKTDVPGPKSIELLEMHQQYVARAFDFWMPVFIASGQGASVTDVDGNTFIDLTGGVGVLNVGHTPDPVIEVLTEHVQRFLHTDYTVLPYESLPQLARELARIAPGDTPKKSMFFNSGAEAVENAVKIARAFTGRDGVLAFEGAFHGRTMMAMSLTSKPVPYKKGYGPYASDVYRVPYPYCYRCPVYQSYPSCDLACFAAVERAFVTQVHPEDCAAVIIEPVQGEGGFIPPPVEYLQRLRQLCDATDVLLILDEVQTGFGRTGRMFAAEWSDIEPDLMVVAKSIAAGIPLSAVVGKASIMDVPEESTLGGTFVGNPLGCVAGLAVLRMIEEQQLVARAEALEVLLMQWMRKMQERFELIGDVRGRGAMCAMELVRNRTTKEPAPEETTRILQLAMKRGLIPLKAGVYNNVIRFLTPLTIPVDQLGEALDILEECIALVANGG